MENYIDKCIKERASVAIIMVNGFQMRGKIVFECSDYLIVKSDNVEKLLYKHAVSTIQPA